MSHHPVQARRIDALSGGRRALGARLGLAACLLGGTVYAADLGKWTSIGPTLITNGAGPNNNMVGRVTSIAMDPSSRQTIYVGARGSGVWKTTDGGATWRPIADALPTLTVAGLAVAPSRPARVYLATPLGVYRSDDAGGNWTATFAGDLRPFAVDGGAMIVSPRNPDEVFLSGCRAGAGGVLRSRDGGVTWTTTLPGCNASLLMKRGTPNELVAGMTEAGSAPAGVYATGNAGDTWRRLQGCPGAALPAFDPAASIKVAHSAGRLFASVKVGPNWRLFRTTAATCAVGGATESGWEAAWAPDDSVGQRLWSYLQADPIDPNIVYATGTEFRVSTDGGLSFQVPSPQPHVDHHAFAHAPGDAGRFVAGSDGGIFTATKGASGTWTFIGEGLGNVEFYDVADTGKNGDVVVGGTQDNGESLRQPGSTVWRQKFGGDAEMVEIADHDAGLWFEAGQALHQLVRSTDGGSSWSGGQGAGLPEGCDPWLGEYMSSPEAKFVIDPRQAHRLLATCGGVWRGQPWTQIFTPPAAAGRAASLAVNRAGVMFTGTTTGKIFAARDNAAFVDVYSPPAGAGRSTDVEPDPFDAGTVYASGLGSAGRVVRLRRQPGAALAFSAADIGAALPPAANVNALAVDRFLPYTIYAATSTGVFRARSRDEGRTWTWTAYNDGLHPASDVRDLEVNAATGVMRAATFGRGAYEIVTDHPLGSVLNATGRVTLLRAHDVGTKFGPPEDQLDVEAVVQLDATPGMSFGLTLRTDGSAGAHAGMFDLLRDALRRNRPVVMDYERTGFRTGRIIRVMPAAN